MGTAVHEYMMFTTLMFTITKDILCEILHTQNNQCILAESTGPLLYIFLRLFLPLPNPAHDQTQSVAYYHITENITALPFVAEWCRLLHNAFGSTMRPETRSPQVVEEKQARAKTRRLLPERLKHNDSTNIQYIFNLILRIGGDYCAVLIREIWNSTLQHSCLQSFFFHTFKVCLSWDLFVTDFTPFYPTGHSSPPLWSHDSMPLSSPL